MSQAIPCLQVYIINDKVLVIDGPAVSLAPAQDEKVLELDPDELRQTVRQSLKTEMTSITGRLPD